MKPEVFNKLNVQSPNLIGGGGASFTREDLLQACQGVDEYKTAFIEYHQNNDLQQANKVYSGLKKCAVDIPEISSWLKNKKHQKRFEALIAMATIELAYRSDLKKEDRPKMNDSKRAAFTGVSVSTWYRGYNRIYARILSIPSYWVSAVMRVAGRRLSG